MILVDILTCGVLVQPTRNVISTILAMMQTVLCANMQTSTTIVDTIPTQSSSSTTILILLSIKSNICGAWTGGKTGCACISVA